MTYDVSEVLSEDNSVKMIHSKHQQSVHQQHQQQNMRKSVGVMGTRRIFTTAFKIKVLDSYRHDKDCRQNQRATARKYGIHRRQIQKWLQCEEQLRNSVENGNTVAAPSANISSSGVSKSDSAVTEAAGTVVTPGTPTLNLNLARQHGDELATQQGPPPLHPPHGSAPSSPQYSLQTTTTTGTALPLCITSVGYQEYSPEQRLRLELEERVHMPEIHVYPDTQVDQERNYYVLNGDRQRNAETTSVFSSRNETKVYQTLANYHSPPQEHRYINDINGTSVHNHSQQREQSYGNVDSFDGRSYGLLLAPSMIKTEPASPDTAATSGPYESSRSPNNSWAPLSPVSHRAADSGNSSSSVHFVDSSRASASPYLHVHAHEHAHASPPLDSEKSVPSLLHQQDRESENVRHTEKEKREKEQNTDYYKIVVKKEVDLDEEEAYDKERITPSSVEYQRPPVDKYLGSLRPVSPLFDRNGYSLPSSPRDSASAGKSKSSWSDSEMDPLAYSVSNLNSSSNFTRRRSFPLRFKLDVLDAFHRDKEIKENQRATARKFGINRRQVQKWLEQEAELRDEITLRGDLRQRLGPTQEVTSGESPLDLTLTNYFSNCISTLRNKIEMEHEQSQSHFYQCDVDSVPPQHTSYYQHSSEIESSSKIEPIESCNLSCSVDNRTTTSTTSSSYQDSSLRESYTESSIKVYCYSPRANSEISNYSEGCEQRSSPLKRQHCTLPCCYEVTPSPKRFCLDVDDSYDAPPQDMPLCLVKPKLVRDACSSQAELITIPTSNNSDAITFKPYLDNPVSKPVKKCAVQSDLSSISSYHINNNNNNNNNCQIICNFNEDQTHNYDFELNLQVPVSWRPGGLYTDFPQQSAFVRVSSFYM